MNRLLIATALLLIGARLWAGTVIASTVTYSGADIVNFAPSTLPAVGAYYFDLVVRSTPTSAPLSSLIVYLQQQGIAGGAYYTVYNSTFSTCSATACTYTVVPDMYLGGSVRAQWSVTSGSATVTVTARAVTP